MEIASSLLTWYQANKRVLPWRIYKDPYLVWISEIMLQQTRIEAVIPYYERFLKRLPNIKALAEVEEDELLKLWEGLGYYNRARNLKKAAQIIQEEYHGVFPSTYEEILRLPGIGEYTASAIASICFDEKTPTVDGNVLRVYTRLLEDRRCIDFDRVKKEIRLEIQEIMPDHFPGDFNEAFMELGEVVCLPKGDPKCDLCPLRNCCGSYLHQTWNQYPVKLEKKEKKELFYTVFLFTCHGRIAIQKRTDEGLLKNLWEFPNQLGKRKISEVKNDLAEKHIDYVQVQKSGSHKHVFSHQIWHMQAYLIEFKEEIKPFLWAMPKELKETYAIPGAFQSFLEILLHTI